MDVKCPSCGTVNWLENQSKCLQCGGILRRCADCSHYNRPREHCTHHDVDIDSHEAEHPTVLASSVNCAQYHPLTQRV